MKQLTELQKKLLGDLREDKSSVEVELPSVTESSLELTETGPRDEFNLTYNQLIEEFVKWDKKGIMKESTFERLWNN